MRRSRRQHGGDGLQHTVRLLDEHGVVDRTLRRSRGAGAVRRAAAAEMLGWLGLPRTLPALVRLLDDRDREVVPVAARALGRMGDPAAVPFLLSCLENETLSPGQAASALLRIGGAVTDRLAGNCAHRNADVRLVATQVLGLVGDAGSTAALIARLTSERGVTALMVGASGDRAAGRRCRACGRGSLYRWPAGVEVRIDGNALLSAVRYELEKLRCSACGEIFTAPMPAAAGEEKYSARARAVAPGPSSLRLDGPAAGLGAAETAELGSLVRRLADEWGMAVLLVEHDVSLVFDVCDRVTVLDFGRTIASGPPAAVRDDPGVIAAYLGVGPEPAAPPLYPRGFSGGKP